MNKNRNGKSRGRKAAVKKVHEEYGKYKSERGLPKFINVHKNSKGLG